ncbi:hypothetical protein OpiT1DRAFT_01996 [Opitutaceae bacterium TAV1]|nr:hypothetical protein OpiT1DRAFT_01996 [Opitutaceae bacterium TAV1]
MRPRRRPSRQSFSCAPCEPNARPSRKTRNPPRLPPATRPQKPRHGLTRVPTASTPLRPANATQTPFLPHPRDQRSPCRSNPRHPEPTTWRSSASLTLMTIHARLRRHPATSLPGTCPPPTHALRATQRDTTNATPPVPTASCPSTPHLRTPTLKTHRKNPRKKTLPVNLHRPHSWHPTAQPCAP